MEGEEGSQAHVQNPGQAIWNLMGFFIDSFFEAQNALSPRSLPVVLLVIFFPPCVLLLCQKQLLMSARNLQRSPGCEAGVIPALSEGPLVWTAENMSQFLSCNSSDDFSTQLHGQELLLLLSVEFISWSLLYFRQHWGSHPPFQQGWCHSCAWGNWGTERGSTWDMQVTLDRGSWGCPSPDLDFSALHWAVLFPFQHG